MVDREKSGLIDHLCWKFGTVKALRMSIKPNTESKASYFIVVRYISWILF